MKAFRAMGKRACETDEDAFASSTYTCTTQSRFSLKASPLMFQRNLPSLGSKSALWSGQDLTFRRENHLSSHLSELKPAQQEGFEGTQDEDDYIASEDAHEEGDEGEVGPSNASENDGPPKYRGSPKFVRASSDPGNLWIRDNSHKSSELRIEGLCSKMNSSARLKALNMSTDPFSADGPPSGTGLPRHAEEPIPNHPDNAWVRDPVTVTAVKNNPKRYFAMADTEKAAVTRKPTKSEETINLRAVGKKKPLSRNKSRASTQALKSSPVFPSSKRSNNDNKQNFDWCSSSSHSIGTRHPILPAAASDRIAMKTCASILPAVASDIMATASKNELNTKPHISTLDVPRTSGTNESPLKSQASSERMSSSSGSLGSLRNRTGHRRISNKNLNSFRRATENKKPPGSLTNYGSSDGNMESNFVSSSSSSSSTQPTGNNDDDNSKRNFDWCNSSVVTSKGCSQGLRLLTNCTSSAMPLSNCQSQHNLKVDTSAHNRDDKRKNIAAAEAKNELHEKPPAIASDLNVTISRNTFNSKLRLVMWDADETQETNQSTNKNKSIKPTKRASTPSKSYIGSLDLAACNGTCRISSNDYFDNLKAAYKNEPKTKLSVAASDAGDTPRKEKITRKNKAIKSAITMSIVPRGCRHSMRASGFRSVSDSSLASLRIAGGNRKPQRSQIVKSTSFSSSLTKNGGCNYGDNSKQNFDWCDSPLYSTNEWSQSLHYTQPSVAVSKENPKSKTTNWRAGKYFPDSVNVYRYKWSQSTVAEQNHGSYSAAGTENDSSQLPIVSESERKGRASSPWLDENLNGNNNLTELPAKKGGQKPESGCGLSFAQLEEKASRLKEKNFRLKNSMGQYRMYLTKYMQEFKDLQEEVMSLEEETKRQLASSPREDDKWALLHQEPIKNYLERQHRSGKSINALAAEMFCQMAEQQAIHDYLSFRLTHNIS